MQEYIDKIIEITADYSHPITQQHILNWVNQFDENDREFLLSEVAYILPTSYISKDYTNNMLSQILKSLMKQYNFVTMDDLLSNCTFLSCQADYKSQSILLDMLNTICNNEYGLSINKNDIKNKQNWIYLDDNLSTGGTFFNNIKSKIDELAITRFKVNNIKIISIFFYLHAWGKSNVEYRLKQAYIDIFNSSNLKFHSVYVIKNHPTAPSSTFNNAYPKDTAESRENLYLKQLKDNNSYCDKNKEKAFRANDKPVKEEFYSSAVARDRYEKIILTKGLDILSLVKNVAASIRPLGCTTPSYQTFGMGSHVFTWRNVSNTCPIVYWWGSNNWTPLFQVNNRGLY